MDLTDQRALKIDTTKLLKINKKVKNNLKSQK